jgi:DNA-binding NarL/FixJ family response regulator
MMSILLADDQPQVRSALRLLLEQELEVRISGEAANAQSLLLQAEALHPDAILIDWELPGLSAVDGIPSVRLGNPSARIVALSSRPDVRQAALWAGADAFVCKGDPPERLLAALTKSGPSAGETERPRKRHPARHKPGPGKEREILG